MGKFGGLVNKVGLGSAKERRCFGLKIHNYDRLGILWVLEEEMGKVVSGITVKPEARPLEGGPKEDELPYVETGSGGAGEGMGWAKFGYAVT